MGLFSAIQHLLPRSEAFKLHESKWVTKLWRGLGASFDDIKTDIDLVHLDLYPNYTRELEEWEAFYGLIPSTVYDEVSRRQILAAEWMSTGGQSLSYIQGVLQAAGFEIYVHECWASTNPYVARDPHDYTTDPLVGTFRCSTTSYCGTYRKAQVSQILINEPGYFANLNLTPNPPPIIPNDSAVYPYFLYIAGQSMGTSVEIPAERRGEFERLIQKLKPTHLWVVVVATYPESLLTESGPMLLTESGQPISFE